MEKLILYSLMAALLGEVLGRMLRWHKINTLKQKAVRSAHYDAFEGLSPAEFGYLVDGKIGDNERIAEFIHLEQVGIIRLKQGSEGRVQHELANPKAKLTDLQIELLHPLEGSDEYFAGKGASAYFGANHAFEAAVCQSLTAKGWIKHRIRTKGLAHITLGAVITAVLMIFVLTFVSVASFIAADVGKQTDEPLIWAGFMSVVAIFILIFGTFGWIVFASYRWRFLIANRIGSSATPKYDAHWEKLYGLALFLKVSGMDTMTPQYETLSFRDLDKLYSYAVAMGADKRVVGMMGAL